MARWKRISLKLVSAVNDILEARFAVNDALEARSAINDTLEARFVQEVTPWKRICAINDALEVQLCGKCALNALMCVYLCDT